MTDDSGSLNLPMLDGESISDALTNVKPPSAPEIRMWTVDELIPYARNSKLHPPEQIDLIVQSIEQFGFTIPVLAFHDGTIIAGHGRVIAAKKIGMTHVPVIVPEGWTEAQMRAYVIADNKLGQGGFDEDMLKLEIGELAGLGIDVQSTGFNEEELDQLFGRIEEDVKKPRSSAPQLEGLVYSVVLRCRDEAHQAELLARFESEGLTAEALIS